MLDQEIDVRPAWLNLRGFTIIELLIALVLLGVLAGLAAPVYELGQQRRRENELRSALLDIRQAIDRHKSAWDQGLIERKIDSTGYPAKLEVLVDGVRNQRDPNGNKLYFLRRIPSDPMLEAQGAASAASIWGLRSYASSAESPKEGEDVFDVYSKSSATGLNGIAYARW